MHFLFKKKKRKEKASFIFNHIIFILFFPYKGLTLPMRWYIRVCSSVLTGSFIIIAVCSRSLIIWQKVKDHCILYIRYERLAFKNELQARPMSFLNILWFNQVDPKKGPLLESIFVFD